MNTALVKLLGWKSASLYTEGGATAHSYRFAKHDIDMFGACSSRWPYRHNVNLSLFSSLSP